ncbi:MULTISPECIES: fluoroquinolone transporter permease [unclassified Crossiella]|uniref:fluoroquinolone export ABC transporter permease subunit n=1 Tax=unclassified Crossiella TaxID=2620835 RepID=UPI001FFED918|nr:MULTISPECIES: fluoroquinolone transporter permease [unclassified Crossiella]MCK2238438.1 fluoroquinolone transporter permease [Crossiella sp. S99.2]MCK2251992.1 fluoroquinolone transporter permease [Crossiella sp. S99.1]
MSATTAALRLDLKLQRRYGFLYAAAFAAVLWIVVLNLLPAKVLGAALPYALFGDLAIVGFFFIAGAVFFEKGERTLFALLSTPLRFREYLLAKLGTLTMIAVAVSLAVVISVRGLDFHPLTFLAGIVLTSLLMILLGFVTAAPYPSVSEWLMPALVPLVIVNVPLLSYSGVWPEPLLYLIPTHGSLLLLGAAFDQIALSWPQLLYALGYQLLWIAGLFFLARKVFERFVISREGAS